MGTADGTEPGADHGHPARHDGGFPTGWRVRYRGRRPVAGFRLTRECIGTIAGPSLRDEHTGTTWVPVRPYRAAPRTRSRLVRATDILDARPPGASEPAPAPAVDADEGRSVVVELPRRDPGDHPG
ncbi:hypothetical protein [Amycolatopsis nalaikhensis]|uniref:Uncharacterized protein n=1 Tax=Amycolatopsis nalaikhensis TaxID=715472 RepID=A0ABY8XKC5_9PSEU|nr:hypothetical protein [Amycolatopsis sp. 2-2]WIV56048.1 hypothetical protein QP939_45850 [Amycolatopsis sp. 2-2]